MVIATHEASNSGACHSFKPSGNHQFVKMQEAGAERSWQVD